MQTDDGRERRGEEEVSLNWLEIAQNGSCSTEWSSFSPLSFILIEQYLTVDGDYFVSFLCDYQFSPLMSCHLQAQASYEEITCVCVGVGLLRRADSQHGT